MIPEQLKTKNLKAYYYLDKDCNWGYLRYVEIDDYKDRPYHVFIYHMVGCSNTNQVEHPRACTNRKALVLCSGCGLEVPDEVQKQAASVWMMEKTNYGG